MLKLLRILITPELVFIILIIYALEAVYLNTLVFNHVDLVELPEYEINQFFSE